MTVSNGETEDQVRLLIVSGLVAAAVLVLDTATPLGVADGMLYVALPLMALWSPWLPCAYVMAAAGTVLTAAGYQLSAADGGIPWMIATNRTMSVAIVWITAAVVHQRKRADLALHQAYAEVETRVAERIAQLREATERLRREADERQRQADRLRRSEANLNIAQRIAGLGSWEWDLARGTLSWSDQLYRIYGLDPRKTAPTPFALLDLVHPADRRLVDDALEKALSEGVPFNVHHRIVLPGGGERVVHQIAHVERNLAGEPMIMRGTTQDVTERRATEQALQEGEARLRGIMDSVPDAIITADERGCIDSFNRAAERIFGYSAEEAKGQNVRILMPEPDRSRHDGYIADYLRTGKARIIGIGPREAIGQCKDGLTFPVEITVSEMWASAKRIFVAVARDITQRRESEHRLRQAQKMEAIGHLTGGVAHDFNNLLTVILGSLELLEERAGADPQQLRLIETATKASLRGADLTQRLLAFSRKQALSPAATDVNALVSWMTDLLRRTLGEQVQIETVLAGGLWPAMIDASQLENSLLNLAINARDAMPDGGKLTIETANAHLDRDYADRHAEVAPGQYVMVAVSDTGTGMTPEVAERAFEPFFTTKDVGKGSGLGLSMVYGFVKQSGGHVKIYTEPGHGTTVKLYLPRAAAAATRGAAEPAGNPVGGHETVLVVEDDPDVRALVVATLGGFGYRVLEAADGAAALALLEAVPSLDLLLTDVVLPGGMNGREVADAVAARNPKVRVLFTSGYTENAIIHHGRLDNGVQLLVKPYTRFELARAVRRALDGAE